MVYGIEGFGLNLTTLELNHYPRWRTLPGAARISSHTFIKAVSTLLKLSVHRLFDTASTTCSFDNVLLSTSLLSTVS